MKNNIKENKMLKEFLIEDFFKDKENAENILQNYIEAVSDDFLNDMFDESYSDFEKVESILQNYNEMASEELIQIDETLGLTELIKLYNENYEELMKYIKLQLSWRK